MKAGHWKVTAYMDGDSGSVKYVTAPNAAKAVEVVEAELGTPPGSVSMDIERITEAALPAGGRWLK